jgi:hypothetical protein
LRIFAPTKNSTPLFSINSALFGKNTRGGGVARMIANKEENGWLGETPLPRLGKEAGLKPAATQSKDDRARRAQHAAPLQRKGGTFGLGSQRRNESRGFHSVMMRSAHSTKPTKIVGLPNLAPH